MATTSQWEVVGKSSTKKPKTTNKSLTKAEKKAFAEALQRKELSGTKGPVNESKNTYEVFMVKDDPPIIQKKSVKSNGTNMNGSSNAGKKQTKPKKPGEKKKSTMTLDEGLSQIHVNDIEALLTKDQTTFPENPSLWLKDLASFINVKLDTVPEPDPLFEKQQSDYPLCKVPKNITKILRKTLDSTTFAVLELFFEHCVKSMITDMGKGASTYGFRIFIQLMAHDNPKIVQANLSGFLEQLKTNQNRPLRCLSVMWAAGQPGVKNLASGLRIWMDVMFPVLGIRALASYAVTYLENLFKCNHDLRSAYGAVSFREFFPIFDVIFTSSGTLPSQLHSRLLAIYPKIKAVSFTDKQDVMLRHFFPSFLARASPNCSASMKAELQSCLLACLTHDKHCLSLWRQMYTKHFLQSGFLLQCLVDNWDRTSLKVDRKILLETVRTFNVTNEDLAAQKKTNFDGYNQCNLACKALLAKDSGFHFPWFYVILTLLILFGGLIYYDVHTHGKFIDSKTHVLLTESGTIAFCNNVCTRIQAYYNVAYKWMEKNVPYYYAETVKVIGPYLVLFWAKTQEFWSYLVVVTEPTRAWLYVQFGELSVWLQARGPVWYRNVIYYVAPVWETCLYYGQIVKSHTMVYLTTAGRWLQENVFVGRFSLDNIYLQTIEALLHLRRHLTQFIQWCSDNIASAVSS